MIGNRIGAILFMMLAWVMQLFAQDFLSTETVTLKNSRFSASVEFPIEGAPEVVSGVMQWMGEILGAKMGEGGNFHGMLQAANDAFSASSSGERHVLIERSYEDSGCVTFESMVTDKDGSTVRTADCASFSKRDGHRITMDEIFDCDMQTVKRLMWEYRDELPMEADGPEGMRPLQAGFIDGWVVVIGPARGYKGAPYMLRYEEIEEYLKTSEKGYYE